MQPTSPARTPADVAGHATVLIRAIVIGAGLLMLLSALSRAGRY